MMKETLLAFSIPIFCTAICLGGMVGRLLGM